MAFKYLTESLPWLVPSAAIAFAAYVFMEGKARDQAAPVVTEAIEALPETSGLEEIVTRQAAVESPLASLSATPPVARPAPSVPPEPVVQAVPQTRETVVKVEPVQPAPEPVEAQCVTDLKAMAGQARVYFPSGGLTADAAGIEQGTLLSVIAQTCPGVEIWVDGHTDPSGGTSENQALSERRADEVIARIAASGIDTSMFRARGLGAAQPSDITGPKPSAYYDRRVEFAVVESDTLPVQNTPPAPVLASDGACIADLRRAVAETVLLYAPRSVSLRPDDLARAMRLAERAASCPQARLRVIGHYVDGVQTGEDAMTGELRAKALKAMLVGQGIVEDEIVVAAPARPVGPTDANGLPGSRVDFEVITNGG